MKITHGLSSTSEYGIWSGMRKRCENPKCPAFKRYGGRGIVVCERWRASFADFLADMGPRPSPKHSLDRIDVNGNYEPGNVRWATAATQARNTRRNHTLTVGDETLCLSEWGERFGIQPGLIQARIDMGWTTERAVTTPSRAPSTLTVNGVTRALEDWGRRLGGDAHTISSRMSKGWAPEAAVSRPLRSRGPLIDPLPARAAELDTPMASGDWLW